MCVGGGGGEGERRTGKEGGREGGRGREKERKREREREREDKHINTEPSDHLINHSFLASLV